MKKYKSFIKRISALMLTVILSFSAVSCIGRNTHTIGDCNNDKTVDGKDSQLLCRYLSGEYILISKGNADLNSDGVCNSGDTKAMRDYLAGVSMPGTRFSDIFLNNLNIGNYNIVIPENATSFEKWTAQILHDSIEELCGIDLETVKDSKQETPCEILIGATNRSNVPENILKDGEYVIFARTTKIILSGKDYYVAGGVGHILNILEKSNALWNTSINVDISYSAKSHSIEWNQPDKVFLFIGDGMGFNHTILATDRAPVVQHAESSIYAPDEKGTDVFWPSTFENKGEAITLNIQQSTTDSAAGATALSTGYKTLNGALGMIPADLDGDGVENEFRAVLNVREAAALNGLATAVISTDKLTGATPNAFLVHHTSRKDRNIILEQQTALTSTRLDYNYLWCSYDSDEAFDEFKKAIDACDDNKNGFFIMTEEAMIDKYAEKMDFDNVIRTVKRLNTMTAYAATYAMCHRDTAVIVTADHETGGLTKGTDGIWRWTSNGEHTGTNVPVFAMGAGTDIFYDCSVQNTVIAKFIFSAVE